MAARGGGRPHSPTHRQGEGSRRASALGPARGRAPSRQDQTPGRSSTRSGPRAARPSIAKHYLDSFADTTLRKELDALGVGHLVICGAATDACIRATSARALIEGYDTTLVGDAHTTDEGPWDLPLPDGRTVPVGAEAMIAYTNFFVADTVYPGITTSVVNHDEVEFQSDLSRLGTSEDSRPQ